MKWWADWLADNRRDHARCPGLIDGLVEESVETLTVDVITVVGLVLFRTVQRRRTDGCELTEVTKEKNTHASKVFVVDEKVFLYCCCSSYEGRST
jgi:hypothetical protein